MTRERWTDAVRCAAVFAVLVSLSCSRGDVGPPRGGPFAPDAGAPTITITGALCSQARASENLRPRADLAAIGGPATSGPQLVHTSDLFVRFRAVCGGCHVDASTGGRQVSETTFPTVFDGSWLATIKRDDKYMPPPPNGKPFSMRSGNDPVLVLVRYLEAWLAAGRPRDVFTVEGEMAAAAVATSDYAFAPSVAESFTNLGNCVTNAAGFENSTSGKMESMDTFWAGATELPQTIAETDLTTFDAETLASTGVIAYVPTYSLWSAGSGKLRHVRVPRGKHVRFDKAAQTFDIPPNTRFYKTFFRKITDRAGHEAHRKMETRLIVTRPDRTEPDGTVVPTALYGTYVWSEDETTATLANLPYRDGTPFADQVRTYITDELAYQDVLDSVGPGANFEGALADALKRALVRNPTLQQHYAIPGRIRCVQCHMGSPTKDFVLGFFPLQVARREDGTGGTYDATGADELNQLQRLIDYGVIKGMATPADVLPLEKSQGARKPRTDAELTAQAYMIGNCAHCHNPRGLPSVTKPELSAALNMLPDGVEGGVFEMSLERMSPIRARGAAGDIPIPYITPSLRDYPVATDDDIRIDNGIPLRPSGDNAETTWTPKYVQDIKYRDCSSVNTATDKALIRAYCGKRTSGPSFVPAPWRSLIYRNVDSPFTYFDDYVPFPHMPMNTFGFDCRAPRIMGDWMVGLPAERKYPAYPENALPTAGAKPGDGSYDSRPQPFQEVRPGDPRYPMALAQAELRLAEYHAGVRYSYCEDVLSPDIYDPVPPAVVGGYRPSPDRYVYGSTPPLDPTRPGEYAQPPIGVPYHGHFFAYDPTDPPPPWSPRRPDWHDILVARKTDASRPAGGGEVTPELTLARKLLVEAINEAEYSAELRSYATTPIAYGLWQTKPGCEAKLAREPKVSEFSGAKRPAWMDKVNPAANAAVYVASPGEILYRHVCVNCHGPNADGKGLQADALAAASEGEARPASFRDGLFGPSASPSANMFGAFGAVAGGAPDMAAAMTWGSRYMAWMALGGTLKRIPQDIIHQVEATKVFGESRPHLHFLPGASQASANMLNLASGLCSIVLPDPSGYYYTAYQTFEKGNQPEFYPAFNAVETPFIASNGDREMWMRLCTRYSPTVVRVYGVYDFVAGENGDSGTVGILAMYYADASNYPATAPVLDHMKVIRNGIDPENLYPACIKPPATAAEAAWLENTAIRKRFNMPDCPPQLLTASSKLMWQRFGRTPEMDGNVVRWNLRGGIATGMAVFSFLQSGGAHAAPKPAYNQCQLLK
jgi:mono/diheme cytochrome c family protein